VIVRLPAETVKFADFEYFVPVMDQSEASVEEFVEIEQVELEPHFLVVA
jgi:hypothetical protein